jgi:RNA recognition motif-containing protein
MATQVYVGNLDPLTTSEEVRDAFTSEGYQPAGVKLVRDAITGRRRGFGFVEFQDDRVAAEAIERLDGTPVGGRKLSVQPTPGQQPPRFVGER